MEEGTKPPTIEQFASFPDASQSRLLFEQIDLHHELTHVALQFGDLVLAPDNPHRLGHLVCELVGFVFADPKPDQAARERRASSYIPSAPSEKPRELALELRTEASMPAMGYPPIKPLARSNPTGVSCPVAGVHS